MTAAATAAAVSQELSPFGLALGVSRAGTKYPVRGIPHFDDWILGSLNKKCAGSAPNIELSSYFLFLNVALVFIGFGSVGFGEYWKMIIIGPQCLQSVILIPIIGPQGLKSVIMIPIIVPQCP